MPSKHGACLAADDLQAISRACGEAGRVHGAAQGDGSAGRRLEEDRGESLAPDFGQGVGGPGTYDAERSEQPAKHIEVMDEHLGDHQPLLLRHEGLALQNGAPARGVRQQARGEGRHIGLQQLAGLAGLEPALQASIPGPKAPVLVDHQPRLARHAPGERLARPQS